MGKKKQPKECKPTPPAMVGGGSESESPLSDAGSSVPLAKGRVGRRVTVLPKKCISTGTSKDVFGLGKGATNPREVYSEKHSPRSG